MFEFDYRKFDELLRSTLLENGRSITHKYIEKKSNKAITAAYVSLLRNGERKNPSKAVVDILAGILNVDANVLYNVDIGTQIALRSAELDEDGKTAILDMIEYILATENDD